ncbi:hypothetical protein [uncultured Anoxybacillus sp.]|uniref:hypothetical protein n=1 Tax=uncultured Anoxybacillus sp. TaxID=263860 RepID=UPI00260A3F6B|nr:hypothetical protein [uncultured Anoxybacillus sp.]
MKYMFLEFKFIKRDMNKILLLCVVFPLFGTMICLKGGMFHSNSLTESMEFLFGSVNLSSANWMYWLLLCFGYVILFQLIWKKREKNVEHNVLILLQDTSLYYINRLAIGLFFTLLYVSSAFFIAIVSCIIFLGMSFRIHLSILLMFVCIVVNFYLHAVLLMFLKFYTTNHFANVFILTLFFAGVKMQAPFMPLYYGMIDHFRGYHVLLFVLLIEVLLMLFLGYIIVKKFENKDYF